MEAAQPRKRTDLPRSLTPFIGREEELAGIMQRLQNPTCRLLSVIGPGGVGKTRLALECAVQLSDPFPDGRFFIDLQPVQSPESLVVAVADALSLRPSGSQSLARQLTTFLQEKTLLLLLDNMEHLLAGVPLLADLLLAAPDLKLLTTSREALNLDVEWLYPLAGLPYPDSHQVEDLEAYGAVALFSQRARRLRPGFSLDEEKAEVVAICRLVEGLPLALDLAATWVKTVTCAEIAAEIRQSLDFLSTQRRQTPAVHSSMRAVFEHSWQLLSGVEQTLFCRLAAFQGGFERQAAAQVTEASLLTLSALVDKSLLYREPNGRYYLHTLLHQFALERLTADADTAAAIRRQHCRYFADFMHGAVDGLKGKAQIETLDRIQADLENVRTAWRWAVAQQDGEAIQKISHALSNYFQLRGQYQEPVEAIEDGLAVMNQTAVSPQRDEALAMLHLELCWFSLRLGRIGKASYHAGQAQALLDAHQLLPPPGIGTDPRLGLGLSAATRGDYREALAQHQQAYDQSVRQGHTSNRLFACYGLADAALALDDLDTTVHYARQGVALSLAQEENWLRAYLLNQLGSVALRRGELQAAKGYYEESYAIRERFNDPEGMGLALNHLGEIYLQQAEMGAASECFSRSLSLYRETNDRGGLATALAKLGQTAVLQQQLDNARHHLAQALTIAAEIGYGSLLQALCPWLERLLRQLESEPAAPLAEVVAGKTEAVTAVAIQLQTLPISQISQPPDETAVGNATLLEPLTGREIEVLRHIAHGLTNREIADTLVIAPGTVKWYTGQIYGKLGVRSRTQAIACARQLKLLAE
jgi:predicted ATPase/DNA-binding CsgD family transcriptional regulator